MEIQLIPIEGLLTRVLVVDDDDHYTPCENCGGACYYHPHLAKEDMDWCMTCNDEHYRGHMSSEQLSQWAMNRMVIGLAIMVVKK